MAVATRPRCKRSPSASSCSAWPSSCWLPACLGLVGWLGQRAPISVRLALRDLSRYRSRSGPALAAIAVATLIAVIVCVEAAARLGDPLDYAGPNLSSSQLVVYTAGSYNGPAGGGGTGSVADPVAGRPGEGRGQHRGLARQRQHH